MANLPEKVIKQRLKLQLQSMDSPSELPTGYSRSCLDMGVSPMTDLAMNLHSSSLGMTPSPSLDNKRKLYLDSSSSDSSTPSPNPLESSNNDSPAPPAPMVRADSTPLSSITNKPARNKLAFGSSRLTALKTSLNLCDTSPRNKENLQPVCTSMFSPSNKPVRILQSPSTSYSCKFASPVKEDLPVRRAQSLHVLGDVKRRRSIKRPMFSVVEEDSRDSGFSSQPSFTDFQEDRHTQKKARADTTGESLEEMLADCSPGKEEGFAALPDSPVAKVPPKPEAEEGSRDGFPVLCLPSVEEDSTDSTDSGIKRPLSMSFLSNRLILPSDLEGTPAFQPPEIDLGKNLHKLPKATMHRPPHRPQFRRALSMMEPSQYSVSKSSHTATDLLPGDNFSHLSKLNFKRPDPPREGPSLLGGKKRRMGVGETSSPSISALTAEVTSGLGRKKPIFSRSFSETEATLSTRNHTETELTIMKSCQLKEEMEDILPDSSRLYALPSISSGTKHPSLRTITCHTLAEVMEGRHKSTIRSFRIVDVRYKFEYDGGHIQGAENWQHGEDEEFLSSFLPDTPLPAAPPTYDKETYDEASSNGRDILIFHCEFSSQRGPDFYKKLRERDRQLNKDVYPGLYFPECYLLHMGYKEFWRNYPSLCTGTYTQMDDPRHETEYRKMRAKSKSWSGGTVARTSRVGRLNL